MENGKLFIILVIVVLVLFFLMMAVFYVFLHFDSPTTYAWINTRWGGYGIRRIKSRMADEHEWAGLKSN